MALSFQEMLHPVNVQPASRKGWHCTSGIMLHDSSVEVVGLEKVNEKHELAKSGWEKGLEIQHSGLHPDRRNI